MNIVFYSSNSNVFLKDSFKFFHFPKHSDDLKKLCSLHPEHNFTVITNMPGYFLLDAEEIPENLSNLKYKILPALENSTFAANSIANEILKVLPDIAIACTYWIPPFDWLGIEDALIAEELKKQGIRTLSHTSLTQMTFFNKYETHLALKNNGFNVANAVYVNHELYWEERSKKEILHNVYKEYIFEQIKKLNFPVVIKDTTGLSSYGMEVAVSFKEAVHYLNLMKRDVLVEEFLSGIQAGTEIYGTDGDYKVMPPLIFSVNKYKITSPKQSIKLGPVDYNAYNVSELNDTLTKLAKIFKFSGIAQVDLVFKNNKWFIIEVNPRLSGMTQTYCALQNITPIELLYSIATKEKININLEDSKKKAINIKLPLQNFETLEKLTKHECVKKINQIQNLMAKQEREKGYCELVLSKDALKNDELIKEIKELCTLYPEIESEEMWKHLTEIL